MTWWDWARKVGALIVTVAVVEYLAVPQLVHARSEMTLFADAVLWLLAVAFALEVSSLMCYTALTRVILPAATRPSFGVQFLIDLTGLGASHFLPGGGASASALRYRLMTSRGLAPADALSTAALETAVGFIGLVITFTVGVAGASPSIWTHPIYVLAGIGGLTLLISAYVAIRVGAQHFARSPRSGPIRVPNNWFGARIAPLVASSRAVAERGLDPMRHGQQRRAMLGWAVGNWALDAACLWMCLRAYGINVQPGALLAAYGAANLIGLLPLTPGGLGIIEGILIPSLAALGAAGGPVVLGVLTWRALEFWLPIPVSGLTYVGLRFVDRSGSKSSHRPEQLTSPSAAEKRGERP
jgi:uncharacterized protein (TIRG00374 family)